MHKHLWTTVVFYSMACSNAANSSANDTAAQDVANDRSLSERRDTQMRVIPGLFPSVDWPQVQPETIKLGDKLFVVWNAGGHEDDNGFDLFMAQLSLEGVPESPPKRVTDLPINNDVDPELTLVGNRVLMVWTSDSGMGPDNLRIRARSFDAMGNLSPTRESTLETERNMMPLISNHWMPSLHTFGSQVWLSGTRAVGMDGFPARFQTFYAKLDTQAVVTESHDAWIDLMTSHGASDIALGPNDTPLVAFESTPDMMDTTKTFLSGPGMKVPLDPFPEYTETLAPRLFPIDDQLFLLSVTANTAGRSDVVVALMDWTTHQKLSVITIGESNKQEFGGRMFPSEDTNPLIAYHESIIGNTTRILARRIMRAGNTLSLGSEVVVVDDSEGAKAYNTSATFVTGNTFHFVWSAGTGTDLRIEGRTVAVP